MRLQLFHIINICIREKVKRLQWKKQVKEVGYSYENMEHICGNDIRMGENMIK
jgi:hypothetical protein